jgi:hypothetical protein
MLADVAFAEAIDGDKDIIGGLCPAERQLGQPSEEALGLIDPWRRCRREKDGSVRPFGASARIGFMQP